MNLLEKLDFSWRKRLPVIQQTQAAECGLTCTGMIANYYGYKIDMITLRRRFSTSLKGATLADIMQVSQQLGMSTRALRLEIDELHKLSMPCILHWDMNHFVVLKEVTKKKIIIHDPSRGRREVALSEVSKSFTGIALELIPNADFVKKEEKESLSMLKLIGNVSGIGSAFFQVMILSIGLEVFGLLTPFYSQWVMDQVLVSADYDLLTLLGCAFITVVVLQNILSAIRAWVTTWFSSMLSVQWSANVCSHLLGLPMAWFEERHVGDIVSRYGSITTIQNTLTSRFISSILDGVMAIVTLIVLFTYNVKLTFVVLVLVLVYILIRWISFRPFRQANEEQLIASARAQSQLLESIRGVQAVKLNNKQEMRVSTYANELVEATNKGIHIQRLSIGFNTLQGLISGVGRIVLIWMAALEVLEGNFSAGMLIAFTSFADQFTGRTTGLIDAIIEFWMLRLHGERLADIVLTEKEGDMDSTIALPSSDTALPIEVKNLTFRYAATEPWIFQRCSLRIESGESVAIVGPSGQGKSTLAKLLLGLLKPEDGCIEINGQDIRKLGMSWYREHVSSVMQDDILFAGSIMDNISFFDSLMAPDRVEQAAKLAHIHEDIMAMPMGYNSLVGDMGSSLSGGQIQRVLLARALYRQPKILLLDEATSHLDIAREKGINDAIKKMDITRIIIAHRPETIRSADRIILVNGGTITELPKSALPKE
ncbi:peptidase domain-containing ABC transporter [Citrobacter rodentium]|nr:peptidase domain-containing ABC transporter [Citrobacter rodentium]KIQ52714.1 ABC transporter [Citrobacter rodentium]QBY32141.1 peptidase domain-containing ABC transporter [Citrobacter rodentium]UHO33607.1 peptidase domain-containing ABC transporter [Citrobacter rodentium NBRC 105723 = DSM 16636]HAT8013594.1 peptidase domain-containing ABC transporter [Citrobacter rodentium NBRC 105723 = DSM 16636]HAT8018163.1 peptidase domain-containing ABC transporter [Citrobacter rodentium]